MCKEGTPHLPQILSITCDNASCNDVMISELAKIIPSFSEVGHIRCFLHIINLVAKSMIRQFDIPKKQNQQHLDNAEQELRDLAGDIDLEERRSIEDSTQRQIDGKTGEPNMEMEQDDDIEGWIDEMTLLSPIECKRVKGSVHPVRLVLVKVSYQWYMTKL